MGFGFLQKEANSWHPIENFLPSNLLLVLFATEALRQAYLSLLAIEVRFS